MSNEASPEMPPVPGALRLGWLLFVRPFELYRLFEEWGLGNLKLRFSYRRLTWGDSAVRTLLARWGLWIFVIEPLVAVTLAMMLGVLGVPIKPMRLALGVGVGVVMVAAASVVMGIVLRNVFGVKEGIALGGVYSVGVGAGATLGLGTFYGLGPGTGAELAYGALCGTMWGLSPKRTADTMPSFPRRFGITVVLATALGVVVGVGHGFDSGVADGITFGIKVSAMFFLTSVRGLAWIVEALVMSYIFTAARITPTKSVQLSRLLPILHHELIYLPLPGLWSFLLRLAEQSPTDAQPILARAATSVGQRRIAQSVYRELQARSLEAAARSRKFSAIISLDLPFLPSVAAPADSPFHPFICAARDLAAGGPQRDRQLALERAQKQLEKFIVASAGSSPDPLQIRLLQTAGVFLEVIQQEASRLADEIRSRPELSTPFIAGNPVKPTDTDGPTLFKGRDDLITLLDHDLGSGRRGVVLVTGQRRMGKTTLRYWLGPRLGTGTLVVDINFQELSGASHREAPHRMILDAIANACPDATPLPDTSRWGEGLHWLIDLDSKLGDLRLLVVLDEVERIQDGIRDGWCTSDVLDFLRAAGDSLRHIRFLLLTAYPLQTLGPDWLDRLVSATVRWISYLDEQSARDLLEHPIPEFPNIYPEGGVDRIIMQTACHPYLLQKVGDELCRLLNARDAANRPATNEELDEAFDNVVADANLFDELWRQRNDEERAAMRAIVTGDLKKPVPPSLVREGYVAKDPVPRIMVPLFARWIEEFTS